MIELYIRKCLLFELQCCFEEIRAKTKTICIESHAGKGVSLILVEDMTEGLYDLRKRHRLFRDYASMRGLAVHMCHWCIHFYKDAKNSNEYILVCTQMRIR